MACDCVGDAFAYTCLLRKARAVFDSTRPPQELSAVSATLLLDPLPAQ